MLTLSAGPMLIGVLPEVGGSFAFARFDNIDFLRPVASEDLLKRDILGVACFPMVPYANRIAGNEFVFRGERYLFEPNLPNEPLNEHGSGWQMPWTAAEHGPAAVTMSLEFRDPENPYSYDAVQTIAVRDDGFGIAMEVVNRGRRAMPFGFGQHPSFPRDADASLAFDAADVWLLTPAHVPRERIALPPELSHRDGKLLPPVYRNNCYGGWDGKFEVRYPSRGLRVEVGADPIFRHLMLYADPAMPFFCVEPQTNATCAFNQLGGQYDGLGEIILEPGAKAVGTIDFRVARMRS